MDRGVGARAAIPSAHAHAGSRVMRSTVKAQGRSCICKTPACKRLTKCFQSMKDIRGRFFTMPCLDGQRNIDVKTFKVDRICHHLKIGHEDRATVCTRDNRDRSGAPKPSIPMAERTRSKSSKKPREHQRTSRYVAYHHYHPELLQEAVINRDQTTIDYLTVELIHRLGLFGNGYTEDDRFRGRAAGVEGDVYVPVPSYEGANRDYKLASERLRIGELVDSCRENQSQQSSSTRGNVEDLLPMDEENVDHLQRAVCILADENNELQDQIRRLEERLSADRYNVFEGDESEAETPAAESPAVAAMDEQADGEGERKRKFEEIQEYCEEGKQVEREEKFEESAQEYHSQPQGWEQEYGYTHHHGNA